MEKIKINIEISIETIIQINKCKIRFNNIITPNLMCRMTQITI